MCYKKWGQSEQFVRKFIIFATTNHLMEDSLCILRPRWRTRTWRSIASWSSRVPPNSFHLFGILKWQKRDTPSRVPRLLLHAGCCSECCEDGRITGTGRVIRSCRAIMNLSEFILPKISKTNDIWHNTYLKPLIISKLVSNQKFDKWHKNDILMTY